MNPITRSLRACVHRLHWLVGERVAASGLACAAAATLLAPTLAALTTDESRHFLARTGFGGTPAEIAALEPLDREQAVDWVLKGTYDTAPLAVPGWCATPFSQYLKERDAQWKEAYAKPEGKERDAATNALRDIDTKRGRELKRWWYQVMIASPSPLSERLTLFWHNHFTSSLETVEDPRLMFEQNVTLRKHAAGNFGHFAKAIPYDVAMFRYLDSNSNTRGRPNENFAREVMELFTVGEGNYSEQDIKEAARAFTGYKINNATGKIELNEKRHDGGKKTVLGNTGTFDADKILETLLVKEEDVALYIAGKLYREFINEYPQSGAEKKAADKEIYEIAARFYKSRYQIKEGLKRTFMSEQFWDPAVRGNLIKSPAELLVGTVRTLGLSVKKSSALDEMGKKLGQDLFDPPNVKGWHGGTAWISTHSMMSRWEVMEEISKGKLSEDKGEAAYGMAEAGMGMAADDAAMKGRSDRLVEKSEKFMVTVDPNAAKWIEDVKGKGAEGVAIAARTLLPLPPTNDLGAETNVENAVRRLLLDPAYNLK